MSDDKKQNIVPESPDHDEQPIEHVRTFAPEPPNDPDKPIVEDESTAVPTPGGPIV